MRILTAHAIHVAMSRYVMHRERALRKNIIKILRFFTILRFLRRQYIYSFFNCIQYSTNNTQNEYKYPTVFVLQKTGLTGFLQMPRQALGLQGER